MIPVPSEVHSLRSPLRTWGVTAIALFAGATFVASQVSAAWFMWLSGIAFALLAANTFLRARAPGRNAAEALPVFVLYFVFALLLRGIGVGSGFVDSPYVLPLGDRDSPHFQFVLGWVFFYCAVGMVAVEAGYGWSKARAWGEALANSPGGWNAPWRTERMLPVAIALLAGGFLASLLRISAHGGFSEIAGDPVATGTTGGLGRWWLVALTELTVVGYHVLVLYLMLGRMRHAGRWSAIVGVVIGIPLYIVTSGKFLLLRILVPPLLFSHFLRKPLRMAHFALIFLGFALLFPFFYAYRALGLFRLDLLGAYLESTESPLLKVYNRAYDADSFMLILHRHAEGMRLMWGQSFVDLFSFFIPRAMWADKPQSFGLTFPALYMSHVDFGGMTYVTPSLPGELFLDFHVPGIIVGFFLFGVSMRIAWQVVSRCRPGALLAYGYFFLMCVHMAEGGIASQLEQLSMSLVPAYLAHLFLRERRVRTIGPDTP